MLEVEAGYFGSYPGNAATSVRILSNGVLKTLKFTPGSPGGAASVDSEKGDDIGWTPAPRILHVMRITMRKSGWHTYQIVDGEDQDRTWSKDFKVLGWWVNIKTKNKEC